MIHVTIGHYVILPIIIFCHDHTKNSKTQSNLFQIYFFAWLDRQGPRQRSRKTTQKKAGSRGRLWVPLFNMLYARALSIFAQTDDKNKSIHLAQVILCGGEPL